MMSQKTKSYVVDEEESDASGASKESVVAGNSYQDKAFSFLDTYRVHLHRIPYTIFYIYFLIQTLPLLIPSDIPYGTSLQKGFQILNYVNHFGFIWIPYSAAAFIAIGFLALYIVTIGLIAFSYYLYSRGSGLFDKVKLAVHIILLACSIFSFPLLQLFSRFWQCDYTTHHLIEDGTIECWTSPNVAWAVIGLIGLLFHILIHSFAILCIADMSLGPKCSFFTSDSAYYVMWEHFSYLLLQFLARIAFVSLPFFRPLMVVLQAFVSIGFLFGHLPFFYSHVNALISGVAFLRLIAGVGGFILTVGNIAQNDVFGIVIGSIQIFFSLVAFVVGIFAMEVFIYFIKKQAVKYGALLNSAASDINSVRVHILEMAFRISITHPESRVQMERIVKRAGLESVENTQLLVLQAVVHIFVSTATLSYASLCLQKSTSYRPNIFMRLIIYQRYQDLELATSQSSNKKRIYQIINTGKNFQMEVQHYRRAFWKALVSSSIDLDTLSNLSHLAYLSETECDRIYSGLINKYPKNINVVRVYASYLEDVKMRADDAVYYYSEAEALEEQEQERLRQKRKAFTNEYEFNAGDTNEPPTPSPTTSPQKESTHYPVVRNNSIAPVSADTISLMGASEYNLTNAGNRVPRQRRSRFPDEKGETNTQPGYEMLSDNSVTSSVRKQQLYLKQLSVKDNKWVFQILIYASLSILLMAYVFMVHGVYSTQMDYLGIDKLKTACHMQTVNQL
jgi:hypothetical protein